MYGVQWNRRRLSAKEQLGMLLCVILSVLLTHLHILNTLTFVSAVFLLAEVYLDACDCV